MGLETSFCCVNASVNDRIVTHINTDTCDAKNINQDKPTNQDNDSSQLKQQDQRCKKQ